MSKGQASVRRYSATAAGGRPRGGDPATPHVETDVAGAAGRASIPTASPLAGLRTRRMYSSDAGRNDLRSEADVVHPPKRNRRRMTLRRVREPR